MGNRLANKYSSKANDLEYDENTNENHLLIIENYRRSLMFKKKEEIFLAKLNLEFEL
jgi:hypothetical protein